jgi:hypothetical protein
VTAELATKLQLQAARLEVVEPASLPQTPEAANRLWIVAAGLAMGLSAGLVVLGVRRWPLVAASGAAGAAIAGGISFLISPVWVSVAVLRIVPATDPAPLIHAALTDDALSRIASSLPIFRERLRGRPAAVIAEMRRDTFIRMLPTSAGVNGFEVSFQCRDRETTHAAVHRLVATLVEANLTSRLGRNVEVLDPASLPEQPVAPNRLVLTLMGLGAGLLVGCLATVLRRPRALSAGAA